MNMNRLLARHGLKLSDAPKSHAGELLDATLSNLGAKEKPPEEVDETVWLDALTRACGQVSRRGGEGLVNPLVSELPLADIDPHVRGIVRWMNELGIHTAHCCDGHGERTPYVALLHQPTMEQLRLLKTCLPDGMKLRRIGKRLLMESDGRGGAFELLLEFAERLHRFVEKPDLIVRLEAEEFKNRHLMNLLEIPGPSGREEPIRRAVIGRLRFCADDVYVDDAGNVLATKYCGDGPTVLLSAHMDVCRPFAPGRRIVEDGNWLRSTAGILGADDRAGIAVALYLCERIRGTNFRGTLKLAFTVQEEVGLVGAGRIDRQFMRDIDAAIVVDRRGNRDIVTSCRGSVDFCSPSYGRLFEQAGELAGMKGWKTTAGGYSDALVFAEKFGIDTVNLSAGYVKEHTEEEALDYVAAYETAKLIETALHHRLIGKRIGRREGLCV
jgi:hypothetical protein